MSEEPFSLQKEVGYLRNELRPVEKDLVWIQKQLGLLSETTPDNPEIILALSSAESALNSIQAIQRHLRRIYPQK